RDAEVEALLDRVILPGTLDIAIGDGTENPDLLRTDFPVAMQLVMGGRQGWRGGYWSRMGRNRLVSDQTFPMKAINTSDHKVKIVMSMLRRPMKWASIIPGPHQSANSVQPMSSRRN